MIRELKGDFGTIKKEDVERASKYIVLTGDDFIDYQAIVMLEMLRRSLKKGIATDVAKYNIPEAYKTELIWTINARSLRNFLSLRTSPKAHFEIRELAKKVYFILLHNGYSILFEDLE